MLYETQKVKTRDLHTKKLQGNMILDWRTPTGPALPLGELGN